MIAGRYDLVREVGRGGMGAVWLARDQVLDRSVALKQLGHDTGVEGDPGFRRAQREARLAATLSHPHVVSILDLVIEDHQQWLVMEYVEGRTLAQLVQDEGPLPPDRAAGLLGQVAEALVAAHTNGIVHRDVKPSNMLVTSTGLVKLTDFGIARATGDESLTQTGMIIGSPAYLAPEVVSGGSATAASDVWSLGASGYFALTGVPAYQADGDLMATLYRIVSEDPPRPPEPGWLAPLFEGTMVVDPDQRWSMAQVGHFLSRRPTSRPAAASPPFTPSRPSPPLLGSDPGGTQVLPAAGGTTAPASPGGRRGWSRRAAAGLAVAGLLGAILVWALLQRDPTSTQNPSGQGSSPSNTTSTDPAGAEGPTVAGMQSFVTTYVDTATTDQAAAWQLLTPEFQRQSGSFEGYRSAWQGRPRANVSQIAADPQDLTVSYDVAYFDAKGRPLFEDRVTLTLVYRNGSYLISGEG